MAKITKTLNTRIALKVDTLENWNSSDLVLLSGEIAIATVAASAGSGLTEPVAMIKIGDGAKTFSQLDWNFYAKASDVLTACKSEESLKEFITSTVSTDKKATDEAIKALQDRATAVEGKVNTLNGDENTAGSVAKAIKDAIAALDLANTYAAKEHEHVVANITDFEEVVENRITAKGYATTGYADGKASDAQSAAEAKAAELDAALKNELSGEIAKKVDKVEGYSLVSDTEIARLAEVDNYDDSELSGRVEDVEEAIGENGSVTVAIADAKKAGTDAADALDAYKGEMTTTLAGKQDVIAENTYDAYGAAGQALVDAKAYVDAEDVFEIDMLTVNAHGGIAANTDLNGMTTHEILKKILYPYVEPTLGNATASPNGGTYEKGVTKTIASVSISVTKKSEAITSVALYNGSTLIEEKTGDDVKNGGTITFSNVNVEVPTNGNQLTVKVTDAANKTYEKKTTSMTFVYPYYMGSCAAGTAIDEALVESLTKKVESKGNKSNSFTVSDGHMVFAYPKAHGVLKSILDPNNFETIGNYTRSEVNVTGLDGTTQAYYVYVSGATTVSGFTVNFKY